MEQYFSVTMPNTPRPLFSREKNPRFPNRRFGGLQSPAGRFEEKIS
jgi:hypothetical protein